MPHMGDTFAGKVKGVPVQGYWEGRGLWVQSIPGQKITSWLGLDDRIRHGYIDGETVIEIGGVYLLDGEGDA